MEINEMFDVMELEQKIKETDGVEPAMIVRGRLIEAGIDRLRYAEVLVEVLQRAINQSCDLVKRGISDVLLETAMKEYPAGHTPGVLWSKIIFFPPTSAFSVAVHEIIESIEEAQSRV